MKFCGKCGAKLVEGNEFCTQCGTKINLYAINNEPSLSLQDENNVYNTDIQSDFTNTYHHTTTCNKHEREQSSKTDNNTYPTNELNQRTQSNHQKTTKETIEVEYTAWFGKIPYRNIYHTIEFDDNEINIIKYRWLNKNRQHMAVAYSDIRNINVSRKYGIFDMIGAVTFTALFFFFLFNQSYIMALLMIIGTAVELSTGICSEVTISYGGNGLIEIPINAKLEAENLANKLYGRMNDGNNKNNW